MNSQHIINQLRGLKNEIPRLQKLHPKSNEHEFSRWKELVVYNILSALDNDKTHPLYERIEKIFSAGSSPDKAPVFRRQFLTPSELAGAEAIIENVISMLEGNTKSETPFSEKEKMSILISIFQNFHRFAQQLKERQNHAKPILIENEYALQDFIHAILRLHFQNVKNEFPLPDYCGKTSRIDFYLKEERIGIEVKFVSENLKADNLRKQLIEDKAQYINSRCFDEIIFFIYDPQTLLNKPEVFYDIEGHTNEYDIRVIVSPTA